MKLYNAPHSPYAARVRTQIYAKGINDIEILPPPGFGTPAFKEINTTGKIPALEVDDMVIPESMVIMEYIEQVFPEKALRPSDAKARAVVNLMARFPDVYIQPALFPLFREVMQKTGDQEALKNNIANLKTQLKLLDDLMGQYNWGTQTDVDFADCALAPTVFWAVLVPGMFGESDILKDTPRVQSWWERCKANPVIGKVITEMDEGFKAFMARFQK
jgi:glutathione S-transferase